MSSKAWRWKRSEAIRAVKVVQAAGLPVTAVKTNPQTGEITVYTGSEDAKADGQQNRANEWDEVLIDDAHPA